jgi:hypothetical protein
MEGPGQPELVQAQKEAQDHKLWASQALTTQQAHKTEHARADKPAGPEQAWQGQADPAQAWQKQADERGRQHGEAPPRHSRTL